MQHDSDTVEIPDLVAKLSTPKAGVVSYEGYIKFKLVHAYGKSLFLPDLLVINFGRIRWFQPRFFCPPMLSFFDEGDWGWFQFEVNKEVKVQVFVCTSRLVRTYADGSFLYRCRVEGPPTLRKLSTGACTVDDSYRIWLDLFHHTTGKAGSMIRQSQHFLGSRWNYQGTKKLENVEYVYFTSLSEIKSRQDLISIGMASDGEIHLQTSTGFIQVTIPVYREDTNNRRYTIKMSIPAEAIAPQHVWKQAPIGEFVFYEVSHPAIFRVGLEPGTTLPFENGIVDPSRARVKGFDYAVLGDGTTAEGLKAPYDEENTKDLFKFERCEDPLAFWRENANTDHYTGRVVEKQVFEK